jgi:hypothetical protein
MLGGGKIPSAMKVYRENAGKTLQAALIFMLRGRPIRPAMNVYRENAG